MAKDKERKTKVKDQFKAKVWDYSHLIASALTVFIVFPIPDNENEHSEFTVVGYN